MRTFLILLAMVDLLVGCSADEPSVSVRPTSRPSAFLDGSRVTIEPSGASFLIPHNWIEWHKEFKNNLHLNRGELDDVELGEGEWDTEYASVCNAVFPFDRCAAHVGGEGWGRQAVSYGDLQMRVYDLADPVAEVAARISKDGSKEVEQITGEPADLKQDADGHWHRSTFTYPRNYGDYGATAYVDIRLRRFGERTFALVFMHTDFQSQSQAIAKILVSFLWVGS